MRKFDLDIRDKSRVGPPGRKAWGRPHRTGINYASAASAGILGVNGSGKTTLLRTLVQDLPCLAGEVYQQPRFSILYFRRCRLNKLLSVVT